MSGVSIFNSVVHPSGKINSLDFNRNVLVTAASDGSVAILDFAQGNIKQKLDRIGRNEMFTLKVEVLNKQLLLFSFERPTYFHFIQADLAL